MIIIKKLIYGIFILSAILSFGLFSVYLTKVKEVEAVGIPHANVCHCEQPDGEPSQCKTFNLPISAVFVHLTQHDADHPGSCGEDVCDNLEGIQEDTPEGYENDEGYCFVSEEPQCEVESWTCEECNDPIVDQEHACYKPQREFCDNSFAYTDEEVCEGEFCEEIRVYDCGQPEPTPTPTIRVFSSPDAPHGPECENPTWAPTITEVGRVDSDTVFARFTKVKDNVNTYHVWYGLSKENLPWATKVTGEYLELSGPDLVGKHVWLKVAGDDNGCIGPFSEVTDP